jgi:hypothetical protein
MVAPVLGLRAPGAVILVPGTGMVALYIDTGNRHSHVGRRYRHSGTRYKLHIDCSTRYRHWVTRSSQSGTGTSYTRFRYINSGTVELSTGIATPVTGIMTPGIDMATSVRHYGTTLSQKIRSFPSDKLRDAGDPYLSNGIFFRQM